MKNKKVKKNSNYNYQKLGIFFLALALSPFIFSKIYKSSTTSSRLKSACDEYFNNKTFSTNVGPIKTTFLGELHGINEKHVADCIEELAVEGDHLLLEIFSDGEEITCDALNSEYGRFNGKLKCFGFDEPVTEARRLYSDYAYRADFIIKKSPIFLNSSQSGKKVIASMIEFANFLESQQMPDKLKISDEGFITRQAKYIKKLAKSMSGLSVPEMEQFLLKRKDELLKKANYYHGISRGGPSNRSLAYHVKEHQQEPSYPNRYSIFAVTGENHLDLQSNSDLKKITEGPEPISILKYK